MFAITWRRFQVSSELVSPFSSNTALLKMDHALNTKKAAPFRAATHCGRNNRFACLTTKIAMLNGTLSIPPCGGTPVKSKFTIFLLAAGLMLASSNGFAAGSAVSANLRLMAFGNAAELKSVTNAVARFNQKYPNVKVEITIDPISQGWGDYVTRVLSQFNANNAHEFYGTHIEQCAPFGLFRFRSGALQVRILQRQDLLHPDHLEQHHD